MYYLKKKGHILRFVMLKKFRLGVKLQLFVYNNGITFKISKLIVGHIERLVLGRKVTVRTFWTYKHHLRLLFMEWHPDSYNKSVTIKDLLCR